MHVLNFVEFQFLIKTYTKSLCIENFERSEKIVAAKFLTVAGHVITFTTAKLAILNLRVETLKTFLNSRSEVKKRKDDIRHIKHYFQK